MLPIHGVFTIVAFLEEWFNDFLPPYFLSRTSWIFRKYLIALDETPIDYELALIDRLIVAIMYNRLCFVDHRVQRVCLALDVLPLAGIDQVVELSEFTVEDACICHIFSAQQVIILFYGYSQRFCSILTRCSLLSIK